MQRSLLNELINWKEKASRKPLLIDGARQVGKSYLVDELFGKHFDQVLKLNFLEDPKANELFTTKLSPQALIEDIELYLGRTFNPATDLIFFDEIGECQAALNALKFFCEQCPDLYICAAGSHIGALDSFPVGKVQRIDLFPMNFEEFLSASGNERLLNRFRNQDKRDLIHRMLWEALLDYYFVGGMPQAVNAWFSEGTKLERVNRVNEIHRDVIDSYIRNFGRFGGKINARHIEVLFRNVPVQLSTATNDSNVKKYRFSNILPSKRGYTDLHGLIHRLEISMLVSKCYQLTSQPQSPLNLYAKDNRFKLFFFDVGLLNHLLGLSYTEIRDQQQNYKGFIAENFVQNELRAAVYPTYCWTENTAEIEFLYKNESGDILPVRVESGTQTKSKSLRSYCERYHPNQTVRLTSTVNNIDYDPTNMVLPVYYASQLKAFVEPTD